MIWKDEIVEEVRQVREEYAARFGYDLDAICRDLQEQERQSTRHIVSFSLEERAKRGSREKLLAAMAKVPDVEPAEYDRLPS